MSEQSMLIFNILDLFHNFSLQVYRHACHAQDEHFPLAPDG